MVLSVWRAATLARGCSLAFMLAFDLIVDDYDRAAARSGDCEKHTTTGSGFLCLGARSMRSRRGVGTGPGPGALTSRSS